MVPKADQCATARPHRCSSQAVRASAAGYGPCLMSDRCSLASCVLSGLPIYSTAASPCTAAAAGHRIPWCELKSTQAMGCAAGHGDGVHLLTGPIYVCGAEPGDVLQVISPIY